MCSLHNIIKLWPFSYCQSTLHPFLSPFLCIFAVFRGKKKKSSSNLYILYASKQNVKVRVFLNTFYPLYPKVLQALKSFPNIVGVSRQWSRLVWLFLDSCGSVCLYVSVDLSVWRGTGHPRPLLAQDVQVDRRGFSHGE